MQTNKEEEDKTQIQAETINKSNTPLTRSFRTETPITHSTEFYLESASSPDTLIKHHPSPSMNMADLRLKQINPKMVNPLTEIYCQAKYSEDDFEKLHKAKIDKLRHVDLSFDHNFKNFKFPAKGNFAWKRLSDIYNDQNMPYCIFKEREVDERGIPTKPYYNFYSFENLEIYRNAIGLLINGSGLGYIQRLFVKDEEDWASAAYRIKINMVGVWTEVVVDDFFPIYEDEGNQFGGQRENEFLYSGPIGEDLEIWLMVIEKALAKLYGGYHKLVGGTVDQFLANLTGAPCKVIDFKSDALAEFGDVELDLDQQNELWEKLSNSFFEKNLLSVSSQNYKLDQLTSSMTGFCPINGLFYLIIDLYVDERGNRMIYLQDPSTNEIIELPFQESLTIFSQALILEVHPTFNYNSAHIPLTANHYVQSIIKIGIQEQGTYIFEVNQKPKNYYNKKSAPYSYNKISLTLAKLVEGGVEYVDHIACKNTQRVTLALRDTKMQGSYVILIDVESNKKNYVYESQWEGDLSHWRDVVLSVYGTEYCRLDSLALDPNRGMIYDFFLHRTWKNFAKNAILQDWIVDGKNGEDIRTEWEMVLEDSVIGRVDVNIVKEVFVLPHLTLYKFSNHSEVHLELSDLLEKALEESLECFGPLEVNNIDPKIIINSNSNEILLFKYNNKISMVEENPLLKRTDFTIKHCLVPNPEEYYGQDPYDYMAKLYTVQPSRTYPAAYFPIGSNGLLVNNLKFGTFVESELPGQENPCIAIKSVSGCITRDKQETIQDLEETLRNSKEAETNGNFLKINQVTKLQELTATAEKNKTTNIEAQLNSPEIGEDIGMEEAKSLMEEEFDTESVQREIENGMNQGEEGLRKSKFAESGINDVMMENMKNQDPKQKLMSGIVMKDIFFDSQCTGPEGVFSNRKGIFQSSNIPGALVESLPAPIQVESMVEKSIEKNQMKVNQVPTNSKNEYDMSFGASMNPTHHLIQEKENIENPYMKNSHENKNSNILLNNPFKEDISEKIEEEEAVDLSQEFGNSCLINNEEIKDKSKAWQNFKFGDNLIVKPKNTPNKKMGSNKISLVKHLLKESILTMESKRKKNEEESPFSVIKEDQISNNISQKYNTTESEMGYRDSPTFIENLGTETEETISTNTINPYYYNIEETEKNYARRGNSERGDRPSPFDLNVGENDIIFETDTTGQGLLNLDQPNEFIEQNEVLTEVKNKKKPNLKLEFGDETGVFKRIKDLVKRGRNVKSQVKKNNGKNGNVQRSAGGYRSKLNEENNKENIQSRKDKRRNDNSRSRSNYGNRSSKSKDSRLGQKKNPNFQTLKFKKKGSRTRSQNRSQSRKSTNKSQRKGQQQTKMNKPWRVEVLNKTNLKVKSRLRSGVKVKRNESSGIETISKPKRDARRSKRYHMIQSFKMTGAVRSRSRSSRVKKRKRINSKGKILKSNLAKLKALKNHMKLDDVVDDDSKTRVVRVDEELEKMDNEIIQNLEEQNIMDFKEQIPVENIDEIPVENIDEISVENHDEIVIDNIQEEIQNQSLMIEEKKTEEKLLEKKMMMISESKPDRPSRLVRFPLPTQERDLFTSYSLSLEPDQSDLNSTKDALFLEKLESEEFELRLKSKQTYIVEDPIDKILNLPDDVFVRGSTGSRFTSVKTKKMISVEKERPSQREKKLNFENEVKNYSKPQVLDFDKYIKIQEQQIFTDEIESSSISISSEENGIIENVSFSSSSEENLDKIEIKKRSQYEGNLLRTASIKEVNESQEQSLVPNMEEYHSPVKKIDKGSSPPTKNSLPGIKSDSNLIVEQLASLVIRQSGISDEDQFKSPHQSQKMKFSFQKNSNYSSNQTENPLSIQNPVSPRILKPSFVDNSFIQSPKYIAKASFVTSRQLDMETSQNNLNLSYSSEFKENYNPVSYTQLSNSNGFQSSKKNQISLKTNQQEILDKKKIQNLKDILLKKQKKKAIENQQKISLLNQSKHFQTQKTPKLSQIYNSPQSRRVSLKSPYQSTTTKRVKENILKKIVIVGDCERSSSIKSQPYSKRHGSVRTNRQISSRNCRTNRGNNSNSVEYGSNRIVRFQNSSCVVSPYSSRTYLKKGHTEYDDDIGVDEKTGRLTFGSVNDRLDSVEKRIIVQPYRF